MVPAKESLSDWGRVAKRANYGFEKRQKEIKRQQKNEAKAEKKRARLASGIEGEEVEPDGADDDSADGDEEGK